MRIQLEPLTADFNGIIEYHCKKIDNGLAELLSSPLHENTNPRQMKPIFREVSQQKPSIKFPCLHLSINLQHDETLTANQYTTLANDYLKQMGWDNTPAAVFQHTDKEHSHIHIVLSTVDYDGKKIDLFESKKRSIQMTPSLEIKYQLKATPKLKNATVRLAQINHNRYLFQSLIKKSIHNNELKNRIEKLFSPQEISQISTENMTNLEAEKRFQNKYEEAFILFQDNGLIQPILKEKLLKKLEFHYSQSNTHHDFLTRLIDNDIYIRHLTKKGNSYYVYGDLKDKFYLKDTQLPGKFTFENLKDNFPQYSKANPEKGMLESAQKHLIYNGVQSALRNSTSYHDFKTSLTKSGITLLEHKNSGGTYGISFQVFNITDSQVFKASDINRKFSYTKLLNHFSAKEPLHLLGEQEIIFLKQTNDYLLEPFVLTPQIASHVSYNKDYDPDNYEGSKKKKKRNQGPRPII